MGAHNKSFGQSIRILTKEESGLIRLHGVTYFLKSFSHTKRKIAPISCFEVEEQFVFCYNYLISSTMVGSQQCLLGISIITYVEERYDFSIIEKQKRDNMYGQIKKKRCWTGILN